MKAHQDTDQLEGIDKRHALGNKAADERAKLARCRHPQAPPLQQRANDHIADEAVRVAILLAKASARWPPAGPRRQFTAEATRSRLEAASRRKQEVALQKKQRARASAENLASHTWSMWRGRMRCSACWCIRGPKAAGRACPGKSVKFLDKMQAAVGAGHGMFVADAVDSSGGRAALAICCSCGAWTQSGRSTKLGKQCAEPSGSGPSTIRRVRQGLHPCPDFRYREVRVEHLVPWPV